MLAPLRGAVWVHRSPPSHSASIPVVFHSYELWGFLSLALEPWAWGPDVELGPLLFSRNFCSPNSQDIPPDFYPPQRDVGPFGICDPPTSLDVDSLNL